MSEVRTGTGGAIHHLLELWHRAVLLSDPHSDKRGVGRTMVDVVAGKPPETYEDTLVVRDELSEARDARLASGGDEPFEPPSPQMSELHRRLTSRYPCICDDPGGPWSDGPLINNFGQDVATLGVSYSRVAEVLPFLVTTANEMGFWVLDCQDEILHLPGGTAVRPAAAEGEELPEKRWWQFWK
jgi:hypothetical protein